MPALAIEPAGETPVSDEERQALWDTAIRFAAEENVLSLSWKRLGDVDERIYKMHSLSESASLSVSKSSQTNSRGGGRWGARD